jgi:hypothetical protein
VRNPSAAPIVNRAKPARTCSGLSARLSTGTVPWRRRRPKPGCGGP